MAKIVMGLFDNLADANAAAAQLSGLGIAQNHIRVVVSEGRNCLPDRAPHVGTDAMSIHHPIKPVNISTCVMAGGLAGAVAGLLVVLALISIPDLHVEAIEAMGPIGSLLTGTFAAGAGGCLIGTLIGVSLSRRTDEIPTFARHGGAMASATVADDQAGVVEGIFSTHHATDLELRNAEWETAGQPHKVATSTLPPNPSAADHQGTPPASPSAEASIYTNPDRSTSARVYKP